MTIDAALFACRRCGTVKAGDTKPDSCEACDSNVAHGPPLFRRIDAEDHGL